MNAAARAPRPSGFQRQVLSLYRAFMKETRKRPAEQRDQFAAVIRQKFKEKKNEPRYEFVTNNNPPGNNS